MKIALIAATGRAGSTLLKELAGRGHEVKAVARNIEKIPADLSSSVTRIQDDLSDVKRLAEIFTGVDVVVSAFGPSSTDPRYTSDQNYTDQLVDVTGRITQAVALANVPRLIVVGGAGSLMFSPETTVLNSGHWPAPYVPIARSHVKAFQLLRDSTINWSYFSPPTVIMPGERTGKFRLGLDDLIKDADGKSRISFEDYAVALVDEAEVPKHERQRFTIGY